MKSITTNIMLGDDDALLTQVKAALERRDFKEAQGLLNAVLKRSPNNVEALRLSGRLLRVTGNFDRALGFYAELVSRYSAPEDLLALYKCQAKLRKFSDAEATLQTLCTVSPNAGLYAALAKMKRINGKESEAKELVERAFQMFPDNARVLLDYALELSKSQFSAALQLLEEALPRFQASPKDTIPIIQSILHLNANRPSDSNRGQSGALTWSAVYQYGDRQWLAQLEQAARQMLLADPNAAEAYRILGQIAIAEGRWSDATACFQSSRALNSDHVGDVVTFDPEFFRKLEDAEDENIFAALAPVVTLRTIVPGNSPVLFLASDPVYFWRFTLPLIEQVCRAAPGTRVHVQLLDGDEAEWTRCLAACDNLDGIRVSMAAEASGVSKTNRNKAVIYYHSARIIRLYQFLSRYRQPTWMLDVDAELTADPTDLLASVNGYDLVLSCGNQFDPWFKFHANSLAIAPTGAGVSYLRLVAAYISQWRSQGIHRWGVDQAGLFCAYAYLAGRDNAPNARFLDDGTFGDEDRIVSGAIRFMSGLTKFADAAG